MLAPNNKIISYNSRIQRTQDQNFSSSDKSSVLVPLLSPQINIFALAVHVQSHFLDTISKTITFYYKKTLSPDNEKSAIKLFKFFIFRRTHAAGTNLAVADILGQDFFK